jgi:N utilization substance protein B
MPSASRRQARIVALQTLYEIDSTHHQVAEVLERNLSSDPAADATGIIETLDEDATAFARALVEGVLAHQAELDAIIVRSAPNWPIDQMSRIDKGILRLAIFEILFDNKVPLKAAINEAVELGKRFGSDSSSRFINGVLGTVADLRQSQGPRKGTGQKKDNKGTKEDQGTGE